MNLIKPIVRMFKVIIIKLYLNVIYEYAIWIENALLRVTLSNILQKFTIQTNTDYNEQYSNATQNDDW